MKTRRSFTTVICIDIGPGLAGFRCYAFNSSNRERSDVRRPLNPQTFTTVAMKRILIGGITVAIIGTMTYGFFQWKIVESQKHDLLCGQAKQTLQGVEIRARALAAGLSVEAYGKAEEDEVATLIGALDAAKSEAEVDSVIEAHAATIEAVDAAIDAQVDTRGDQTFLEQRLVKQRIPVDVKQELQRAAKAVSVMCS